MSEANSATYVYCLLQAASPPALDDVPQGLPGLSAPRALELGDGRWLLVADAPLPQYGAAAIESRLDDLSWVSTLAVAHERVIEHFAETATVVPMKLFTLFSGPERAERDFRARTDEIGAVLDRIAAHREWGVRVRFEDAAARRAIADEAAGRGDEEPSGKEFLRRKKEQREAGRKLLGVAQSQAMALFEELSRAVAEARRLPTASPEAGGRVLLDAVFLVADQATGDFEELVHEGAEALAPHHCEVVMTGPWPPYNFVRPPAEEGNGEGGRAR